MSGISPWRGYPPIVSRNYLLLTGGEKFSLGRARAPRLDDETFVIFNRSIFLALRLVRRRVASVSDIEDGLKDSAAAAAAGSPVASDVRTATMRAELFNSASSSSRHRDSWPPAEATIVIELEEYTAMANELADIKSQLITLQNLLVVYIYQRILS